MCLFTHWSLLPFSQSFTFNLKPDFFENLTCQFILRFVFHWKTYIYLHRKKCRWSHHVRASFSFGHEQQYVRPFCLLFRQDGKYLEVGKKFALNKTSFIKYFPSLLFGNKKCKKEYCEFLCTPTTTQFIEIIKPLSLTERSVSLISNVFWV